MNSGYRPEFTSVCVYTPETQAKGIRQQYPYLRQPGPLLVTDKSEHGELLRHERRRAAIYLKNSYMFVVVILQCVSAVDYKIAELGNLLVVKVVMVCYYHTTIRRS